MTKQELLNHLIDSGEYQKDYFMCNALLFTEEGSTQVQEELHKEILELIHPYTALAEALWYKNPHVKAAFRYGYFSTLQLSLVPLTTYIYRNWDKRHQLINGGNHVSRT